MWVWWLLQFFWLCLHPLCRTSSVVQIAINYIREYSSGYSVCSYGDFLPVLLCSVQHHHVLLVLSHLTRLLQHYCAHQDSLLLHGALPLMSWVLQGKLCRKFNERVEKTTFAFFILWSVRGILNEYRIPKCARGESKTN